MKSAIIAAITAMLLALPISVSAGAPLGTITVQGGGALQPGQTATVDVMCPVAATTASGLPIFADVASIWLTTPQGLQLVWQVSSQEPGSCVWISGTGITAFEMPTQVTLDIPPYAPSGKTTLIALGYKGNLVARAAVTVAGTVTQATQTPNPYLTVPTGKTGKAGKGAKTSTSSATTSSTSVVSVVKVVAPHAKTPWWRALLKHLAHLF